MGAQLPGHGGCDRACDQIALLKSTIEVIGDEPTNLLRAKIVRVVITMTQYISTDQDAAFHFGAKAFCARAPVEIPQVAWVGCAMTIAHAVKAAQIARRFGGGDHVIGRNCEFRIRELDAHALRTQSLEGIERGAHGDRYIASDASAKKFVGQANSQSGQRARGAHGVGGESLIQPGGEVLRSQIQARRVHWIESAHRRK